MGCFEELKTAMHKASGVLVKVRRKGGGKQILVVACGKVFCVERTPTRRLASVEA